MTRSMTAYGRATSAEIEGYCWNVEIHSVNRRHLDMHIHLPRDLLFLDVSLRKELAKHLERGQVSLKISPRKSKQGADVSSLKKLKKNWEKIAKELGYGKEAIPLSFLLNQQEGHALEGLSEKKIGTEIKATLLVALKDFLKMKEIEGRALALDCKQRLATLKELLKKIEKGAENSPEKYQKRLVEKVEALLEKPLEDERVLKEVAFYAEKSDITEEITRMSSHIQQANTLFSGKTKSIGRTLDFLIQEMLREVNTIASKSHELVITKAAVEAKAELEKIREQVQNIE